MIKDSLCAPLTLIKYVLGKAGAQLLIDPPPVAMTTGVLTDDALDGELPLRRGATINSLLACK